MNFDEAKEILKAAEKHELRDHAFGDCEITWVNASNEIVAEGYYAGRTGDMHFTNGSVFRGNEADKLRECFSSEKIYRNDETGPDEFVAGKIMPGLTKEGVLKEITGE